MAEIYSKVSANLNFVEREKATKSFWEEADVFGEKSLIIFFCPFFIFSYKKTETPLTLEMSRFFVFHFFSFENSSGRSESLGKTVFSVYPRQSSQ